MLFSFVSDLKENWLSRNSEERCKETSQAQGLLGFNLKTHGSLGSTVTYLFFIKNILCTVWL